MDSRPVRMLVDTGCNHTIVVLSVVKKSKVNQKIRYQYCVFMGIDALFNSKSEVGMWAVGEGNRGSSGPNLLVAVHTMSEGPMTSVNTGN